MDYGKTGLLIASLRKEKGLTQKELADKLGITDRAVSKWERGLGCPDISFLDDLSQILDISILEILKGRRLDRDEIVNNESMIESMNYSRENLKYKFKKYFNVITIFIIVLILLILTISNLKSIYFLNKKYHYNFNNFPSDYDISDIKNNIERIRKDRGIYNEIDYDRILAFVNKLENNLTKQKDSSYLNKNNYTYSEIVDFYVSYQGYMAIYYYSSNTKEIYNIVHNYDPSVVDNMIIYYIYNNSSMQNYSNIFEQLKNPYYNNRNINNTIISEINHFAYCSIERDNMLLKDIIEVGEIDE